MGINVPKYVAHIAGYSTETFSTLRLESAAQKHCIVILGIEMTFGADHVILLLVHPLRVVSCPR